MISSRVNFISIINSKVSLESQKKEAVLKKLSLSSRKKTLEFNVQNVIHPISGSIDSIKGFFKLKKNKLIGRAELLNGVSKIKLKDTKLDLNNLDLQSGYQFFGVANDIIPSKYRRIKKRINGVYGNVEGRIKYSNDLEFSAIFDLKNDHPKLLGLSSVKGDLNFSKSQLTISELSLRDFRNGQVSLESSVDLIIKSNSEKKSDSEVLNHDLKRTDFQAKLNFKNFHLSSDGKNLNDLFDNNLSLTLLGDIIVKGSAGEYEISTTSQGVTVDEFFLASNTENLLPLKSLNFNGSIKIARSDKKFEGILSSDYIKIPVSGSYLNEKFSLVSEGAQIDFFFSWKRLGQSTWKEKQRGG